MIEQTFMVIFEQILMGQTSTKADIIYLFDIYKNLSLAWWPKPQLILLNLSYWIFSEQHCKIIQGHVSNFSCVLDQRFSNNAQFCCNWQYMISSYQVRCMTHPSLCILICNPIVNSLFDVCHFLYSMFSAAVISSLNSCFQQVHCLYLANDIFLNEYVKLCHFSLSCTGD